LLEIGADLTPIYHSTRVYCFPLNDLSNPVNQTRQYVGGVRVHITQIHLPSNTFVYKARQLM